MGEIEEIKERIARIEERLNHISTDIKWLKKLIFIVLGALLLSQGIEITQACVANQSAVIADVKACPYNTSEYVVGVFDCSNMAKMLYDYLTERGHHCIVIYVENKTYDIRHNFLFVDGYAIEPTTKDFAWWYYYGWVGIDKFLYVKPAWMYGKEWEYPRRWW